MFFKKKQELNHIQTKEENAKMKQLKHKAHPSLWLCSEVCRGPDSGRREQGGVGEGEEACECEHRSESKQMQIVEDADVERENSDP